MIREEWLKSMTVDSACGPNLEYDPEFVDLVRSAQGTPERPAYTEGGTPTPAEPPDWRAVREHASALLNRTRDLRVVLLLTRALTNTDGLSGLREGLRLCCDLLEQFWDSVHPQLEFDGEPDPIVRINSVT
ncbi:MAG: type VI secretion system ImpA family N-terminal domain-containing protein, partial [Pseudomonadota bacterium]|nr:type VI secretion system ImpA family N-terminal domain-containing protein [Pseudomonadota bacterium]